MLSRLALAQRRVLSALPTAPTRAARAGARFFSRQSAHRSREPPSPSPSPSSDSSSSSSTSTSSIVQTSSSLLKAAITGLAVVTVGGAVLFAVSDAREDQAKVTHQHRFGNVHTVTSSQESTSGTSSQAARKRTGGALRVDSALGALIRVGSSTYTSETGGVSRIELTAVNANNPMEDRSATLTLSDGRVFAAVFDGHGGWKCAEIVSTLLPSYVDRAISAVDNKYDHVKMAEAISHAFQQLDEELCHDIAPTAVRSKIPPLIDFYGEGAVSGACACAAVLTEDTIYIANTGDSRAVLGVLRSDENADSNTSGSSSSRSTVPTSREWRAAPLSEDQTGDNPSEVARLRREHPGEEETVVTRGRILGGLQPSRAFGDARYKWSREILTELGVRMSRNTLSPPYVTAEPVITVLKRAPSDKFLIIACDGLWDVIDSENAVRIVGEHLDAGHSTSSASGVLVQAAMQAYANEATEGSIERLLAIPAPNARNVRDDITVAVVLLDNKFGGEDTALSTPLPKVELSTLAEKYSLSHDAYILQTQGPDALNPKSKEGGDETQQQ